LRRHASGAPGDFLTVHPEADFTVDRADVVLVPLAMTLGHVLAREPGIYQWVMQVLDDAFFLGEI
jgi:hypothetical protein